MNQKAASSMLWRLAVSSPWFWCSAARFRPKASDTDMPASVSTATAPADSPMTTWSSKKQAASWLIMSSGRPVAHQAVPYWVWAWHMATMSGCSSWIAACSTKPARLMAWRPSTTLPA